MGKLSGKPVTTVTKGIHDESISLAICENLDTCLGDLFLFRLIGLTVNDRVIFELKIEEIFHFAFSSRNSTLELHFQSRYFKETTMDPLSKSGSDVQGQEGGVENSIATAMLEANSIAPAMLETNSIATAMPEAAFEKPSIDADGKSGSRKRSSVNSTGDQGGAVKRSKENNSLEWTFKAGQEALTAFLAAKEQVALKSLSFNQNTISISIF